LKAVKHKFFTLAVLLLVPIVARPEPIAASSCEPRFLVRYRKIEGQAPAKTVGIVVSCVSKADMAKLVQDILATQKPEVKDMAIETLHHASDVSIALTTEQEHTPARPLGQ
jgi:hypothetical protein